MDFIGILNRIDARAKALGLTARAVSLNAGLSTDGIRNWKRRADTGADPGMSISSLTKIATALNVTLPWLLSGDTGTSNGFADDAAQFTFAPSADGDPFRAPYGKQARNPAVTHRAQSAMPDFAINPGDLLVCDLSRLPEVGELVIATLLDEDLGTSTTLIRRYLPPYLIAGNSSAGNSFTLIDTAKITIRYPIIGSIRGAAPA